MNKKDIAREIAARCELGTIPTPLLQYIQRMDYKEAVKPLVLEDREKGFAFRILANKYKLTYRQVQWMCNGE